MITTLPERANFHLWVLEKQDRKVEHVRDHELLELFGYEFPTYDMAWEERQKLVDERTAVAKELASVALEKGEPVKTSKGTLYPPDVKKVRELQDALKKAGFRQRHYDEFSGAFSFINTPKGVKVESSGRSTTDYHGRIVPDIRIFRRVEGKYPNKHSAFTSAFEGGKTVAEFVEIVGKIEGDKLADKGAIQNLILEAVGKKWKYTPLKFTRGLKNNPARLFLAMARHIISVETDDFKDPMVLEAWLNPPDDYSPNFNVRLSSELLSVSTQMGLDFNIDIDIANPKFTVEKVVDFLHKAVEEDYKYFKSCYVFILSSQRQAEQAKENARKVLGF